MPGALVVERKVLEWRFDPASDARLPQATYDLQVIVLCSEGYISSLAAHALQQLGIRRATDVVGGYQVWVAAGLPVRSRLHAVPAQGGPADGTAGTDGSDVARLVVDRDRRVVLAGDREVELTRREFDLLAHLVEHPHRVLTRRTLLDVVWQTMSSGSGGTRTVEVHVHRLRSKLGEPFARGLVTLRGVGYRWSPVG